MSFDLTNKNISDTYQNLLQKTGSNNQLFDLLGNPVTDLTIQGALIAESYIVSQSTLVFSSGSTAFGNSSDDTHNFIGSMNTTGAITASGNISASGDIIATGTGSFSDGRFSGFVGIGNGGSAIAPEALLHLQNTEDDKYLQRWTLNNIEGGIFGDASGDVLKIQVNSNDALAFTTNATERVRIAKDGGTSFTSHITASGNISGSSTSTLTLGGDITTNNTIVLPGDGGTTHETIINAHNQRGMLKKELNAVYWQVGQGTNQFEITDGANGNSTKGNVLLRTDGRDENDNKLFLVPDGAQLNIGGNITASGNISGSNIVVDNIFTGNGAQGGIQLNSSDTVFSQAVRPSVNNSYTLGTPSFKWSELNVNHITASNNISASGDIFAHSGSFTYITASIIDVDGDTIRFGGEEFTKANIQTLKLGRSLKPLRAGRSKPDIDGDDGIFEGNITASGNISASGIVFGSDIKSNGTSVIKSITDLSDSANNQGKIRFDNTAGDFIIKNISNLGSSDSPTFNNITASGDIFNTQVVQMKNSSSVINTFNTGSHKTCKYILQVTSGSHIQSSEMLVMVSASSVVNTEYAQINSGLNLLDFSSKVNGSNVELIGSSSFISCSVKLNRKLI